MERPRILLVDDETDNLRALERTLRVRFEVTAVEDPRIALQLAETEDFAVVVSDHMMPGMLGTDLLSRIASVKPLTTRIILTAHKDIQLMLDAINRAEIYRYVTKPWENEELLAVVGQAAERHRLLRELEEKNRQLSEWNERLERLVEERTAELREANDKLAKLASTDPLTKVLNRRAFFARFAEEIERSKRYTHTLVVVMIDVDHFKKFNDMEGHVRGDEALKRIAQTFLSNLRKTDILGRYGGEEFILLMPETPLPNAVDICERLRATIENAEFQGREETAYLTVSMGVAGYPDQGSTVDELVEAADRALYSAKSDGRNRVVY